MVLSVYWGDIAVTDVPVSIVIPAFNQLDYCRQCITSLRAHTPMPYRLVLVDNGSTDGVSEYFDSVSNALVIHSPTNLGFAGGVNLGLAQSEGHVVLLNSDTLTPEGWLERLLEALNQADDIAMVGPMSNCVSGSQQIDGLSFDSMDAINAYANSLAEDHRGHLRETARLVGFCLLIRDRVVQELGLLDEQYGIGNYEDDDYCMRAIRAGYRLCIAEDAFVFHYGSRTFMGMGLTDDKWRDLIAENEKRFLEKWNPSVVDRSDAAQQAKRITLEARHAMEQGDTTTAIRLLKAAIELCPILESCYNDLGVLVWNLGDQVRAFDYFRKAIQLNPAFEEARVNLRDAAMTLGRLAEVRELVD